MLRKGLAAGVESGESFASEGTDKPTTPERGVQRFEHHELVTDEEIAFWTLSVADFRLRYPAASASRL
jgi:hypothetical protein